MVVQVENQIEFPHPDTFFPQPPGCANAYSAKGANKMGLNDYATALDYYQKALAISAAVPSA